jgi:uncharacterized protein (TIGR03437 family)
MKAIVYSLVLTFATIPTAAAQPQIATNGVVNAASYAPIGWPNSSIAQGSIFTIYGTNLGPSSSPALAYPLETTLADVSVQIRAGGALLNAIPIYVSSDQINAILPEGTPVGSATLAVTYAGQTSDGSAFQVTANSFGIFTINSTGFGQGVVTDANGQLLSVSAPAHPGESAIIWGTGIGASPGDDGSGPPPQINLSSLSLSVYVGTQQVRVTYGGRSAFTGEDQINFVVPPGFIGCYVPVAVEINTVVSNFITMPIGAVGQSCPDPAVNASQTPTGNISFVRNIAIASTVSTMDYGQAFFGNPQILASPYIPPFFGNPYSLPAGACIGDVIAPLLEDVFGSVLDAGPAITISGPAGVQQLLASHLYSGQLGSSSGVNTQSLYLNEGTYVVSGSGGVDVGPFSQDFSIPPPLTWTNQGSISIVQRSAGLDVSWSGGDPNGFVEISGVRIANNLLTFICNIPINEQHFTIPPFILLTLAPSTGTSADTLRISSTSSSAFAASGISSGTVNSIVTISKDVTYQ